MFLLPESIKDWLTLSPWLEIRHLFALLYNVLWSRYLGWIYKFVSIWYFVQFVHNSTFWVDTAEALCLFQTLVVKTSTFELLEDQLVYIFVFIQNYYIDLNWMDNVCNTVWVCPSVWNVVFFSNRKQNHIKETHVDIEHSCLKLCQLWPDLGRVNLSPKLRYTTDQFWENRNLPAKQWWLVIIIQSSWLWTILFLMW